MGSGRISSVEKEKGKCKNYIRSGKKKETKERIFKRKLRKIIGKDDISEEI